MPAATALTLLLTAQTLAAGVAYETWQTPAGPLHLIRVAPSATARVRPATAAKGRAPLQTLAQGAVAAINGGYFDPQSGAAVSWVIQEGRITSDPRQNRSLMNNVTLRPYQAAIHQRTEWRLLSADQRWQWQLAPHGSPVPSGWRLWHALQAGPRLLPAMTLTPEAFLRPGRDAINAQGLSARSGLGLTTGGDLLLVMAAQRQTLAHFRANLLALGCREAMALDGGSSSQLGWQDAHGWHHLGAGDARRDNRLPDVVSAIVVGP